MKEDYCFNWLASGYCIPENCVEMFSIELPGYCEKISFLQTVCQACPGKSGSKWRNGALIGMCNKVNEIDKAKNS